jgi:hypothetical protein
VRGAHIKINIDERLPCKYSESFRLHLQDLPAAAFSHFDVVSGQMTILCLITTVLKGLFINEVGHDILVYVDLISNIYKERQLAIVGMEKVVDSLQSSTLQTED